MFSHTTSLCLSMFLMVVLPAAGLAQQGAHATVAAAAKALGADKLGALHYTGTGSSYVITEDRAPGAAWPHRVMKSYTRDLNFRTTTSRMQLVRRDGPSGPDETLHHAIDANSPWSAQYDFWITPYAFVKAAAANQATVEAKTISGTPYKIVTFTLPGNHKVVGYINDKDLIDKVETWIGEKNDTLIEAYYRDYTDFNGVKVPTMITTKQAGELSLILIVKDVKVEA